MARLIDLSVPMEDNLGEPAKFSLQQIDHKSGAKKILKNMKNGKKGDVKKQFLEITDGEFLNLDIISATTHTGTHIDAPLHYGSTCEGRPARSIDQMPLEWFWGNGVVLDLSFKEQGSLIIRKDILRAMRKINYDIVSGDIVLIRTGADKYWGTREYFERHPGMSRKAVQTITDLGVKVIGIDTYGFDLPFRDMLKNSHKSKKNFFPAHFYGRKKEYCQIERLCNLDKISKSHGFWVSCFPIKIKGCGAAWSRVVAIEGGEK